MGSEARKRSREKLREQREREKRAAKRNKTLLVLGGAALVVLLVVGVGYAVLTYGQGDEYDGPLATTTLQDDGSVVMADEGVEAPVVEVYADYQCPACRQFELLNGDLLKERAAEGEAIVHFRPVSIFAQQPVPISSNSLRAGPPPAPPPTTTSSSSTTTCSSRTSRPRAARASASTNSRDGSERPAATTPRAPSSTNASTPRPRSSPSSPRSSFPP